MPELTVMMPVRNVELTVRSAVTSTLRSMPRDSELVIWDDGSTDDTDTIIDTIMDRRIRLIKSPTSVGGAEARNRVIELSDSAYIASMDGDDICLPWRFRLERALVYEYEFVFGSAIRFDLSNKHFRPSVPFSYKTDDLNIALLFHNPIYHPTFFARRASIDKMGGYRDLRRGQDYDLWLRAARAGVTQYRTGTPLIAYRVSPNQMGSGSDYREKVRQTPEIRSAYFDLFKSVTGKPLKDSDVSEPDAQLRGVVNSELRALLPRLGPLKSRYYQRLLQSGQTVFPF